MSGNLLNKSIKIIAIVLVVILALLLAVFVYFNTSSGQKKLSKIVFEQLSKQIGTPVSGTLSFSIPDWVSLNDLLIKDQSSDTLLYAHKAHLDVQLFMLLKSELVIEQVKLENTVAKLKKENGVFNFDYILDAFASDSTVSAVPKDTSASSFKIKLDGIAVNQLRVVYDDKDLEQFFDIKLGKLNSGLNVLDLDNSVFDLKDSQISGLTVNGKLGKPSTDTTMSGPLPSVLLRNLTADHLNWNIDLGDQVTTGKDASLELNAKNIDLPHMAFEVNKLSTRFGEISFKDKKSKPAAKGEINFSDLQLSDVQLSLKDIVYKDTVAAANLSGISFIEKSGLKLTDAKVLASLKNDKLVLKDLVLSTGASKLNSQAEVVLNTSDYAKSRFDVRITDLKLAAAEALYFDQTLSKNPTFSNLRKDVFTGKGRISGTSENINLEHLYLTAPAYTRLTLNGRILNQKTLGLDLQIRDFSTHKNDLAKFAGELPESIELPEKLTLNGNVKGTLENLKTELFLNSSQGGVRLALDLKNVSKTPLYSGNLILEDYAAGALIKNAELGTVRGNVTFEGESFEKPSVKFNALVEEVNYSKDAFKNISLSGDFTNNIATVKGGIDDKNIVLSLDAVADVSKEVATLTGSTQIKRVDLKALGLTDEDIVLQGDFVINQLVADMKQPFIDFRGKDIKVFKGNDTYPVGNLTVLTEYGELEKKLELNTSFLQLALKGNFEYDKLQNILLGEVNKYFEIPDYKPHADSLDFYFDVTGNIEYDPIFTAFVPALKTFKPITIKSGLTSEGETPFSGKIEVPYLVYDSIQVSNTTFDFDGNSERLKYDLNIEQVANSSFRIRKAELAGRLRDNKASFDLAVKDSLDRDIHSLAGLLESDGEKIRISFDETGSMLFYKAWGGNPYGYIDYSSKGLYIENVVFSSEGQILRVNSITEEPNGPLTVFAENLDLNFLSRAVMQDSTLMGGYLDLDLELVNYMGDQGMAFTGAIDIEKLKFNTVALGDLHAKAESDNLKDIKVFASLDGLENQFELTGAYATQKEDPLDFHLNIATLDFKVLEPYLEGLAYDLKGVLVGDITLKGSPSKPIINGEAEFTGMELRLQETAALFKIDKQSLKLVQSKILFDKFLVKDNANQEMQINGNVDIARIPEIRYDLNISTDNFQIANSERGQSDLFYGKGILGANLTIKGSTEEFKLTGNITAKDGTNLTLLIPDDNVGADLSSVVTFVDFNNPDKTLKIKSVNSMSLANAVNINVIIDEKSVINVLMNPITGDMLTATGNANLNVGFDNAGDLFLIGRLDIVSGSYAMTYQAIQKKFEITPVSKSNITFAGDPMDGQMNITAEYNVPGRKDLSTYPGVDNKDALGRLPGDVRVDLVLSGKIMQPDVDFQIVAKRNDVSSQDARDVLAKLGIVFIDDKGIKEERADGAVTRANRENMTQNAVMLLVAGTFTADQIMNSFGGAGGGSGYEDLARRNVSQIISSQLERYASGLIKGVDINIGLQSSGGAVKDNGVEQASNRSTNLNLGVSKRLANDRLLVSVGKNFELENKDLQSDEIFDNVEINWMITPDGTYRIRVFRRNQNLGATEGTSVVEMGLGFVIAIDYNTWQELLKRKK